MAIDYSQVTQIPVDEILVLDRVRVNLGNLEELQLSIFYWKLVHPIIVEKLKTPTKEGYKYRLIAGERRLQATKNLGEEHIKARLTSDLTPYERKALEAEENLRRRDLTWQEEVTQERELFELKQQVAKSTLPERFGRKYTQKDFAKELNVSPGKLSQDILLAEALETWPELHNCESKAEARKKIRRIESGARILDRESPINTVAEDDFVDCTWSEGLGTLEKKSVALFITDVSELTFDEETVTELLSYLKLSGSVFLFCTMEMMPDILGILEKKKVPYSKVPYMWHITKEDAYQPMLWFSSALKEPPRGVKVHMSYPMARDSCHTLAKPMALLQVLVKNASEEGDLVVDPNAYSSNLVLVCKPMNRVVRAFCSERILREQCLLREGKDNN